MSAFSERHPQSPLSPSSAHPVKKQRPPDANVINKSTASDNQCTTPYIFEELRVVCTLGTGSFGTVKLVHHEPSGDVMALVSVCLVFDVEVVGRVVMCDVLIGFAHYCHSVSLCEV